MFLENCGEAGRDSPRQNHQGLTVLEMQAWSYKLETQDLETESILNYPLSSPPNRIKSQCPQKAIIVEK